MSTFVQLLFSGLALGAVYALVALGFVVIYRSSQVLNFAQGEFLAVGALLMVTLAKVGVPWAIAVLAAMVLTGVLGAAVERAVLRPLVGKPAFVTIIVTIFVGFVLRVFVLLAWGPEPRGVPTPWDRAAAVDIAGARVLVNSIAAMAATAAAMFLFWLVVRRTRLGVAMRATASDQEAALALGIPVGRIFGVSWFLACALAALGGIFLGMFPNQVDANLGYVALAAFPAVIVGGLDSALGAVLASLLLGVLQVLTQGYVNGLLGDFGRDLHAVFPYLVMILFLVVRPYGLFGTRHVERV